ncbi:unnamed protein product [Prunus armeniaca]
MPLATIPCSIDCDCISQYCKFLIRDTRVLDRHVSYHLEASISGCGEAAADSSWRPLVTLMQQRNPRVPMRPPKELLFGVDYLDPNKITEVELAKYRVEFLGLPTWASVAIATPWVELLGAIIAFGLAEEGEPSYEQFSYLYSATRSKCTRHGGWIQAKCLQASVRGHFVRSVPTSQKLWRNRRFHVPTKKNIKKVERARTKVLAAVRVYPNLLLTPNLVKAKLVGEEEMTKAKLDSQNRKAEELAITREAYQQVTGKRPTIIDIDTAPLQKKPRVSDHLKAIFVAEDNDDQPADPVNIVCPLKSVQFANHMIVGSQMDLAKIEELPKRSLRVEAGLPSISKPQ